MVKKKRSFQEPVETQEPVMVETTTSSDGIRSCLDQIRTNPGVIGYILRNTTSASIDLRDPAKISDYAILSSSAFDACKELSTLFDLGELGCTLVEGKGAKMLSVVKEDSRISIFMEKSTDYEAILRKLTMV